MNEQKKIDVVVTYLSMFHPPSETIPAPGRNIALLQAYRPPVHFYRYLYNTVGEPWFWVDRRIMDDETLRAAIHADSVSIHVLYLDGAPAGYFEIDRREAPVVDLAYFGLFPEFTGQGLGLFLLYQALKLAWMDGTREVHVNTCTLDHPKALLTYQRAGFIPQRQSHKQINDPRPLGIIPAHHEPLLPPPDLGHLIKGSSPLVSVPKDLAKE